MKKFKRTVYVTVFIVVEIILFLILYLNYAYPVAKKNNGDGRIHNNNVNIYAYNENVSITDEMKKIVNHRLKGIDIFREELKLSDQAQILMDCNIKDGKCWGAIHIGFPIENKNKIEQLFLSSSNLYKENESDPIILRDGLGSIGISHVDERYFIIIDNRLKDTYKINEFTKEDKSVQFYLTLNEKNRKNIMDVYNKEMKKCCFYFIGINVILLVLPIFLIYVSKKRFI